MPVINDQVAETKSDQAAEQADDDTLVEEHANELGGCGAEGFHDAYFTLFLDGDGKHDRHN